MSHSQASTSAETGIWGRITARWGWAKARPRKETGRDFGTVRVRWTRTGRLFFVICIFIYLAALTSQSGFLLLLIGMLCGCGIVNRSVARRALSKATVEAPPRIRIAEGQSVDRPWRIANLGSRPIGWLEVLGPDDPGAVATVSALGAGEAVHVLPRLNYQSRGIYGFQALRLRTSYPFGLAEAFRPLSCDGEILVHPAIYPTESPRARGYDLMIGGKLKGARKSSSGLHFAGVRPFHDGDPLRQIHWKSSAKGLGLMVKTYEEELSGRVALMTDVTTTAGEARLDACLRAAGSLLFAALDAGHHVETVELGGARHELVPPFTSGDELLDWLARIEGRPTPLNADDLLRGCSRASSRSALALVLTGWRDDWLDVLSALVDQGRSVDVYLPTDGMQRVPSAGFGVHGYTEDEIV